MKNLSGKVALITGASRGIGRAIALELAQLGANIVVNFVGNENEACEVVTSITNLGSKAIMIKADVTSEQDVNKMVEKIIETFGKLDILVNNAGITRDTLIMRMQETDWNDVINTNLKSVFLCTKAVTRPMMKQRSGKIINISSVVGVTGNAGQANYVAAKAGVIGLTKTSAKELASRGINVNAVAPGFIDTDMTKKLPEEVRQQLLDRISLRRFGKPEDIAKTVAFLASEKSDYITGQTITVDGGMY